jgi:hypothetical protein
MDHRPWVTVAGRGVCGLVASPASVPHAEATPAGPAAFVPDCTTGGMQRSRGQLHVATLRAPGTVVAPYCQIVQHFPIHERQADWCYRQSVGQWSGCWRRTSKRCGHHPTERRLPVGLLLAQQTLGYGLACHRILRKVVLAGCGVPAALLVTGQRGCPFTPLPQPPAMQPPQKEPIIMIMSSYVVFIEQVVEMQAMHACGMTNEQLC